MPGIPRDPIQLILIKHPLSTPHRGERHCRKKWPHAGKTKRIATAAKDGPERGAGYLRWGGLERSPHPHPAGHESPREEMAPRGAPGPASAESTADRAGRGKVRSRHPRTTRALLCSKERDPDSGPRENGEPGDRTPGGPERAVTGSRLPPLRPWPAALSPA